MAVNDAQHHDLALNDLEVQPVRKAANERSPHLAANAWKLLRSTANAVDDLVEG